MRWLEALPLDRVAASPELVWLRAWALFETGQLAAAVAIGGASPRDVRAYEARLRGGCSCCWRSWRRSPGRMLSSWRARPSSSSATMRTSARSPSRPPATPSLARGDYLPAVATMRQAFELAQRAGHPMAVLPAVNPLGHALLLTGASRRGRSALSPGSRPVRGRPGTATAHRLVGPRGARDRPLRGKRSRRGAARVGGRLRDRVRVGHRTPDLGMGSPLPGPRAASRRRARGGARGAARPSARCARDRDGAAQPGRRDRGPHPAAAGRPRRRGGLGRAGRARGPWQLDAARAGGALARRHAREGASRPRQARRGPRPPGPQRARPRRHGARWPT